MLGMSNDYVLVRIILKVNYMLYLHVYQCDINQQVFELFNLFSFLQFHMHCFL